ncbi:serine hydrolase domain-containing protein [Thalassotalea castellviae]|uniref:Serine hydrolase domain-containing protein n=1 Tax=Thalassotalea castellviae TaxID=3075612 RepID=A0ABU2ZZX5_9GAMM|nr:serine hydrolase domain-containing protein [Thalassotalea sp. W431]MDT0602266.1 serine hydrolase domain-containing protein [Thalassotalea sp. W431]
MNCLYDCLSGNGEVVREGLTFAYAMGKTPISLMNYQHYQLPKNAANPRNQFQGILTLQDDTNQGKIIEVGGNNNLSNYKQAKHLPKFSFEFVQHGSHIIPVTRGLITTNHANWEYILAPGRVWQEKSDNGYSRVSLPFALQEKNANCTWNGVLSFLFKDHGEVSEVSYQVAADTCLYLKFNMWGRLKANYTPKTIANSAVIQRDYEAEVARRMPTRPISQLAEDYPSAGVNIANIGSNQVKQHMTLYGIAYKGVHYVGGCDTRYGVYPYCDVMAVPSYSTSKTTFGAYGLMRIEQLYKGKQSEMFVNQWLTDCKSSNWKDVTVEHLLDMSTGNFNSPNSHVDESSEKKLKEFFEVNTHHAFVNFACNYPRKATPGSTFVYHTSDTYLLGYVLNAFYQDKTSMSKDFWRDEMVEKLWKPLGLSPTMYTTKRSYDTVQQPFTGYGLTYHRDDVIKLAEFLNNDLGQINDEQMLDRKMVNESLNLENGGLIAGRQIDKYNNGLWYYDINGDKSHDFGCSSSTWIPYMSGYGGISIVLLPNNMTYYHFSDNNSYKWSNSAFELHKISPLCH